MKNQKSSSIELALRNYDFDSREVEMTHRQFSGKRSEMITSLDELLRCWAMSSSTNPNIQVNYTLNASTHDGEVSERTQVYDAGHARVYYERIAGEMDIKSDWSEVVLTNPQDAIQVYDFGFALAKGVVDRGILASFFSLREFVARISRYAAFAKIYGPTLVIVFKEGDQGYFVTLTLQHFDGMVERAKAANKIAEKAAAAVAA